jgi:carbonic anhydrase/acetyltransferase-like protein (isoleucine patch superfamily)
LPAIIGNKVAVGHKAIVHGCSIGNQCLIGMNAVVLDGAVIGNNCVIGANSLVTQGEIIPDNSLVIGSPGKVIRQLTNDEIEHIILHGVSAYVDLIAEYKSLRLASS